MLRLAALILLPAIVLTGCGPASSVLAEDIGYDSLKTNANTPALARGQQSPFQSNTYVVSPYGNGYGYNDYNRYRSHR
jgi:hypothetical protein